MRALVPRLIETVENFGGSFSIDESALCKGLNTKACLNVLKRFARAWGNVVHHPRQQQLLLLGNFSSLQQLVNQSSHAIAGNATKVELLSNLVGHLMQPAHCKDCHGAQMAPMELLFLPDVCGDTLMQVSVFGIILGLVFMGVGLLIFMAVCNM